MAFSAPPNSGPTVRLPRILLVDDDPIVLRALRRLLLGARPGWEIDMAESGQAALSARRIQDLRRRCHGPAHAGPRRVALLGRLKTEQPNVMRVIHSSHVESLTPEASARPCACRPGEAGPARRAGGGVEWALTQRRKQLRDSVGY